ncbi:hypothetical protein IHQ71_28375 [Rhizobium sp. TH2]|uniref:PIN domain-containing protein n=1 Tax=Rhizobium sp. TH2 TaxID=2775403 RepID=UPI0021586B43|nr:PIN domain-containing protein [Rhizobium sp. TH2]UVC08981.1 hypothetical protein IHQ71_28375 [Rhizobium sp. TH2]
MVRYFGDITPDCFTYRPLPPEQRNIVLDANVILDTCLIIEGAGMNAITHLRPLGYRFLTTETAIDEARARLIDFRQNLSSLEPLIDWFAEQAVEVHSTTAKVAGISTHDNHLAALAAKEDAIVLSEDLPLQHDLDAQQLHGRTLREVLYGCVKPHPGNLTLVFGIGLGADGHIFFKADASEKMLAGRRRSYMFEWRSFGLLCYDSGKKAFEFENPDGVKLLHLPFDLLPDKPIAVVLEYSTGKTTRYSLKVAYEGQDVVAQCEKHHTALVESPPIGGGTWLNNSRKLQEGWIGFLQVATYGPYTLGRKPWRACRRLVGVSPPTLTADLAFSASMLCEIQGKLVRRPKWEHVIKLVNFGIRGFYPGKRHDERPPVWFGTPPEENSDD